MNHYGAKADNLRRLSENGFCVPPFYVIDATSNVSPSELGNEFESWKKTNQVARVAVRSSGAQEDGSNSSFAGQFTTVLAVGTTSDFVNAVKTVRSSKPSKAYAKVSGHVHVVVQEFIEPDISGVAFSVNPANGEPDIVINIAAGRGTKVVEGQKANQYFVSRLNPKRYVFDDGGDTAQLTSKQIEEVSQAIIHIEALFGAPQDIEWALKDSQLYILQARPITNITHLRVWDNSNLSESFPGIVLPLTYSIAKRGYMLGYKAQAYSSGLSWYEIEAQHRTFDAMVGIFNGRMYYNLLNWYRFIALFPGTSRNQQFLDAQIETQGQAVYQQPADLSLGFKIKYFLRISYRALFFRLELRKFYKRFSAFEYSYKRLPAGGDTQTLLSKYSYIEQTIVPHFGRTLDNDFFVMTYHGWLKRLLKKWLPGQSFEQVNIIGSVSGVLSAEQALSLYKLANHIKTDPQAHRLLKASSFRQLDEYLFGSVLEAKISEYLQLFGHRFAEDQKIESTNPTLEQYGVYKLLQPYVLLDSKDVQKRLEGITDATDNISSYSKNGLMLHQRILYRWLMRRLKHHLRLREKNRLLRGKVYGLMRDLFPDIGAALVSQKVLQKQEDVFYLKIEELYELAQGALIDSELQNRVTSRRKAYSTFADIEMPERFITSSLPSLEKISLDKSVSKIKAKQQHTGLISSPGTIEGRVVVLLKPEIPKEPYDILVASHTDPGWTPLIALAKGVIVQHGGMLSHAAIVTRELGIPSIIGVTDVTKILKTGMRVRINTQKSCVEILD